MRDVSTRNCSVGPWAAGWIILCLGCAHVESPSGGPEDRDAPTVVGLRPDSAATGVAADTISIQFSEKMNRGSVRDWLFLSPPAAIGARRWVGNRLELVLARPPDTTVTTTILLGSQVKDQRGNSIGLWEAPFSGGQRLSDGAVEGALRARRLKVAGLYVYAWAWEDSLHPEVPEIPPPLRMTQAGQDGRFRLGFLPRGRPLRVCALYDAGSDRSYAPESDLWGCLDQPILVSDTVAVAGPVEVYVVLPDEPGRVQGSVVDSSCVGRGVEALEPIRRETDSLLVLLAPERPDSAHSLADTLFGFAAPQAQRPDTLELRARLLEIEPLRLAALGDSARCAPPILVHLLRGDSVAAEVRGSGSFEFPEVEPGTYRITAFRDVNGNGEADPGEPRTGLAFPIEVLPGRTLGDLRLLLPASG